MGSILVGGRLYSVLGPVHRGDETGLETTIGRGARKRRRKIDLGVWHWTGGEGDAFTLFNVLKKRELGVEFFIDRAGEIYQFCDPALVDTFDAGWVNARSVGVEIANYGWRKRNGATPVVPAKGRKRPLYSTILNRRSWVFAHFWPVQIAAAISLAEALSKALKFPLAVPRGASGFVHPNTMDSGIVDGFSGHLGHFHVNRKKLDPGLDLLQAFQAAWCDEL